MSDPAAVDDARPAAVVEMKLLTTNDVAAIYDVPPSTIRTWNREGTIPAGFFVGRHLRWHPDTIHQDIKRRANTALPKAAGQ